MVLEYLQETDAVSRKKVLDDYLTQVTPRVDVDEIAQLIDRLPPVQPARDLTDEVMEMRAGPGRNATTYHLKLPPEYTHNRAYPVVIVLHNAGEKARDMLARWETHAADHGYVVAAPDWSQGFGGGEYGYTEREHDGVLDTLRDLRRRFQIDSDRVFLFGLGEGGKMAFDVGLAHPDLFAGVVPMCVGPSHFPRAYWRNAQYLPFYAINGTRAGDSQAALRQQFDNWVLRGYPALWVEYKGRGTEFISGELPNLFDWMRHQKRVFPLRQVGTDGVNTQFGNEFCTLRPEDNRFYWLSTTGISPRNIITPGRWNQAVAGTPAMLTARIDTETNEIAVKTQGLNQLTIWLGRNPAGQYMIDFDKPVSVRVGFTNYVNKRLLTPSLAVLLEDLYVRMDRKHLFMARIDLKLR
jgi:pimeloyl-ACP methyl ester carboxylesterase